MTTNLTTSSNSISSSQFMSNFSINPATTTGLTLGLTDGIRTLAGTKVTLLPTTLALTANADNWIATTTSSVEVSIDEPVSASVLYKVVTDGSGITSISDYRGAIPTSRATAW